MPINKSNIKPFACRVTRINGTRNKSITSNLARKGLNIVSIMALIGLSTFCLIPISNTSAETVHFSIAANDVLTVTVPTDPVSLDINPTGTGSFGYTAFDVTVATSHISGYTLTMTGYESGTSTPTTNLARTSALPDNSVPTISTLSSGNYTADNFTTNRWGYKKSSDTYYGSVNSSNEIDDKDGPTNVSTGTTTLNIATKLDSSTPAGYYGIDLVFIATAKPVPYTLTYNKGNATDTVANMPALQEGDTSSTITISSNTPTRAGSDVSFNFNGWCTQIPVFTNGVESCPGTTYAASGNLPLESFNMVNNLTLYAMWNPTSTYSNSKAMQNLTCSNTYSDATQVYDARDGKLYWIQKLADGKCWMTQNLDLDISSNETYTHYNTDLGYTVTNTGETWTPTSTANTINSTTSPDLINNSISGFFSGWNDNSDIPYSANPGEYYFASHTSGIYHSKEDCIANGTETYCNHAKLGNYYNFAAANATNSVNSTLGHAATDNDIYYIMPNSICPTGWRLPTGLTNSDINDATNTRSEFAYLLKQSDIIVNPDIINAGYATNGSVNIRNAPLYFLRTGRASNNGTLVYPVVWGFLWSSTINSATGGYSSSFNSGSVYPNANDNRGWGLQVRCVARF